VGKLAYKIEVDLHGMTVNEARKYLTEKVKNCPKGTREIEVIHGYRQGSALLDFVRNFKHPRVEKRILTMNFGVTIFEIKS
jgi:DNA-nicking Smr family endonuclease